MPQTRWIAVGAALFIGIVAAFQVGKVPAALPAIRLDLGLGMVGAGWIASVYTGTAVALGLAGGAFADRIGHLYAAIIGLALLGIGSFWGSTADALSFLIAARIIEGTGFVLIVVSVPTIILRSTNPRHHAFAMGVWGSFLPVGLSFMLLMAPGLLSAYGWRGLWQTNSAVAFATIIIVFLILRGRDGAPKVSAKKNTDFWSDLWLTVSRPGPWLMSLIFGMFGTQFATFMNWLPTYFIEHHGQTVAAAGSFAAIVAISNAPGAITAGVLMARGVSRSLIMSVSFMVMGALGFLTFAVGLPFGLQVATAILFSFSGGFVPAVLLASAPHHAPSLDHVGTVNGILIHGANVGTLLGPPSFAFIVTASGGWGAGGTMLLVIAGLSAILAFVVGRLERGPSGANI